MVAVTPNFEPVAFSKTFEKTIHGSFEDAPDSPSDAMTTYWKESLEEYHFSLVADECFLVLKRVDQAEHVYGRVGIWFFGDDEVGNFFDGAETIAVKIV